MHTSSIKPNLQSNHSFSNEEIDYLKTYSESNSLLLEASLDAIVGITIQGKIVIWNAYAEEIFGWKKEEIINQSVNIIISNQYQSQVFNILKTYRHPSNSNIRHHKIEIVATDRTHKEFSIELSIATLENRGHALFCAFIRPVANPKIKINTEEQAELKRQLLQKQKEITTAVINAQESERSIIGQELHDNVNQVLTTIKLYNEMLLDGIGEPKELIKKSVFHLQSCINEIRSISKRLSAPTLGKISLQDTLKELVESINLTGRINIIYTIDGFSSADTSQEIHLSLYRIVQEQLNNILNDAEASFATITIIRNNKHISLIIQDDGKGFAVSAIKDGIGIINMKTRAENLNGTFNLTSQPGMGCKLEVIIPLP